MKIKIFSTLFLLCIFIGVTAQTLSSYLFEEFQDGFVQYKDGRRFAVPLNFNLITGKYVFTDNADNLEKEFTEPEMVVNMQIGSRVFLMSEGEATEVIQAEPRFWVLYSGMKKKAPDKISYGGTSETASVDSYSSLSGKGIISGIRENARMVADVHKEYKIQVGKRNKSFYNKRSFLKAFPKKKRADLETYMDENETNFDSVEQVFELYQYAISL